MRKKKSYTDQFRSFSDIREERAEEIRAFWGRVFSPRNLRHAMRTVLRGRREYAAFFAAFLMIQMIFWSVVISTDSRAATYRDTLDAETAYDICIPDLTSDEWTRLHQQLFYIYDNTDTDAGREFVSYSVTKYEDVLGDTRYEALILMKKAERAEKYIAEAARLTKISSLTERVQYSARVTAGKTISSMRTGEFFVILLTGALSVAVILILFLIRTNHYKFTYGIYMSFGAGFEKLFLTAAFEMFAIALVTFVPSLLLSVALAAPYIASSGGTVAFSALNVLYAFLWNIAVILIAVTPSVKIMTVSAPVSLLSASDNSNLVWSPRKSFRIFRKNFPFHYELFSFARFRTYYAGLLASAVLFSSLFLTGLFVSDMVMTAEGFQSPQFIVSSGSEAFDVADAAEIIFDCPGVTGVTWEASLECTEIASHAVLSRRQSGGISSMTADSSIKGMKADNNCKYASIDPDQCEIALASGLWTCEGDLDRVFSDPYTVAVTERIGNQKMLNFNVGDKIYIAVYKDYIRPVNGVSTNKKAILKQQLKNYEFDFIELTVAAVLDTPDTDNSYSIMMNADLFEEITGKEPVFHEVSVYMDATPDTEQIEQLHLSLLGLASMYDEGRVVNTWANISYESLHKVPIRAFLILGSVFLMLISALVWLMSQSNFSKKREGENYMLSAMGARDNDLRKLYLMSGGILALAASAATALLSTVINRLIFGTVNNFMVEMKFLENIRYEYSIPWLPMLACVLISAACAVASTYIPLEKYIRNRSRMLQIEPVTETANTKREGNENGTVI